MNRCLRKLMYFLFMLTITWQCAKAADYTPATAFQYSIANNQVTITKFIGDQTDVSIPPTIEGKPVVAIGNYAFRYHGSLTNVTIPEGVTIIGIYAFESCRNMTSVTIPEGVTSIGIYAFASCSGLTSVTIPSSVTFMGSYAFWYCSNLTSVTISEGVTSIGADAFSYCRSLTSVTIPSSVTAIGSSAFYYCPRLDSVTISDGVKSIGYGAFYDCYRLPSVTIPSSVTSIGSSAFSGNTSLTSITVDDENDYYVSVDGILFDKSMTTIMCYPAGKAGTQYSIPSSVTVIDDCAFDTCRLLSSVTIPQGVTTIGRHAFIRCSSLPTVTIPASVTDIGDGAFDFCTSLASIIVEAANTCYVSSDGILFNKSKTTLVCYPPAKPETEYSIPSTVTTIGDSAFDSCTNLTSVMIPSTVKTIDDDAFSGCSGLTTVTIPEGVTTIARSAFYGCSNLTSVTIPSTVTIIEDMAFDHCTSLTSVTIPSAVTSIGFQAFYYCRSLTEIRFTGAPPTFGNNNSYPTPITFNIPANMGWEEWEVPDGVTLVLNTESESDYTYTIDDGKVTITGYKGSATDVRVPSRIEGKPVVAIGNYAFYYRDDLISVVIPEGVTTIGDEVFYYCENLASITIPSSMTTIGNYAFECCASLTSISIPANVTFIGDYAFDSCDSLSAIQVDSANADYASVDGVLFNKSKTTLLRYPPAKPDVEYPDAEYAVPSGVTVIAEKAFNCCRLTSVTISASVSSIGGNAFEYCDLAAIHVDPANANYTSVDGILFNKSKTSLLRYPPMKAGTQYSVPSGVTVIGRDAFESCEYLTSIMLPSGVTTIGYKAFQFCENLTSITFPSSVTRIGNYAFHFCRRLSSITLPSGVTTIGDGTFDNCMMLRSITIPSGVTSIGYRAFCQSGLTSVTVPPSVKSIGSYAFNNCIALKSVTISEGVAFIGNYAFYACDRLTDMTIPSTMTTIGNNAFNRCNALTELEFNGVPPTFGTASYPTPITFYVHENMGWEEWEVPDGVTLEFWPDTQTQTIQLTAGWNWASFQVLPESHAVNDVLGTAGFTVNDVVQTVNGSARFTGANWIPSSFTIEYGCLYQIYTAQPVTLIIEGYTCEEDSVDVSSGWNWVACPTLMPVRPESLMHSGGWSAGDRIQSPDGSVIYTGSKWIPSTGFAMEPGKGYQIYTANKGTLSFGESEDAALYAVVDLSGGPDATDYPVRYTNTAPNLDDDTCRTMELWLRRIPAGTFIMGSPEDEVGRNSDETQHEVTLTQDFYIGVFECTQKQWELVMGSNPVNHSLGDCRPVEEVSYDMIRGSGWPAYGHTVNTSSFMGILQEKTGLVFDLPTEAEWEYACRAGTTTALNSGKNLINDGTDVAMDEVGRYGGNVYDGKGGYSGVTKVGSYLPNAWGLYDMHGNVFEWCLDWYGSYGAEAVDDPQGGTSGTYRVLRGGGVYAVSDGGQSVGWGVMSRECRSASRHSTLPRRRKIELGFRVFCLP